ncbi:hypothetical protein ACFHW1_26435, partial [Micromonospora sp. LOL_014]|uniref:hypothetical protein n=1 Tax=Micromonospora sp. LOL_014 TaxID=3345415 RepID=UPI003A8385C2
MTQGIRRSGGIDQKNTGGVNLAVSGVVDSLSFGAASIPLEVAHLDPAQVLADVEASTFVGREWLIAQLDQFLGSRPCGYIWIEADAGLGKTALAAWLVQTRGYVAHFSRQASGGAISAMQNLAAQLITTQGLARSVAPGGMLPDWAVTGPGFASLLAKAAPGPGGRLVVVVDGLDELGEAPSGRLPLELPPVLPPGIFVVATYRTGYQRGEAACPATTLRIAAADQRNQHDLHRYLAHLASDDVMIARLAESGISTQEFCEVLARRCGGVWVYLRYLLAEIRYGLRRADDVENLPDDLWGFYRRQVHQWQKSSHWPQLRAVLAALAVVGEPVDVSMLSRFADIGDKRLVRRCVDYWVRPFLTVHGTMSRQYAIYHASFRQFLSGELAPARMGEHPDDWHIVAIEFASAMVGAHGAVADTYLNLFGGLDHGLDKLAVEPELADRDGGYALRHTARHLVQADRGEDLHRLLFCDHPAAGSRRINLWFDAHDRASTLDDYLSDINLARQVAEAATNEQQGVGTLLAGFGLEFRYALMYASVHTVTNNINPDLLCALVEERIWNVRRALGHARRLADELHRSDALTGLAPYLNPDQLTTALDAATTITNENVRAEALTGLAPHLNPDQLTTALDIATTIADEHPRARALTGLAPYLNPDQLTTALDAAT